MGQGFVVWKEEVVKLASGDGKSTESRWQDLGDGSGTNGTP